MLKLITKIIVFVATILVSNQSFSAQVASLYNVDVLVADETVESRNQAFEKGLDEVFIRISGDSLVMNKLSRPAASRYVKRFSYEPVTKPVVNTEEELLAHTLKLQYNGSSMEKYLLEKGFPVWDKHRAGVVIWIVVRDGKNEYVLKSTDQSVVKTAIESALTRRGIPGIWPVYDSKDKKVVSVADVRGGFKEPVLMASKRYSNGSALTGSIIWDGKQWQSSWGLLTESESPRWNLDNADYSDLVDNAVDQAADAMGTIYAMHNNTSEQQLTTIQFDVQSVNSIERYRYIENYLSYLNVVENSKPLRIDGQNVVFEVTLRGSENDFLTLINSDKAFSEIEGLMPVFSESQLTGNTGPSVDAAKEAITPDLKEAVPSEQKVVDPIAVEQTPVKRIPVYRYKLMK